MNESDASCARDELLAHWNRSVSRVGHHIHLARAPILLIVVGQGPGSQQYFRNRLTQELPDDLALREFRFTPQGLNPFKDIPYMNRIEGYAVLASGLEELSAQNRVKALDTLNRNRSMLRRGPRVFILWIEFKTLGELYRHATDFADWWTAVVELPEAVPEPTPHLAASTNDSTPSAVAPAGLKPAYPDEHSRKLSEELTRAIRNLENLRRLRDQGGPTSPSEDSIDKARDRVVELKRELRGDAELFPGDELSARYLLQNRIGHGGFATVWKALDLHSNRIVAIKILHGQYRQDKGRRARFFRGARTMVALKHPHIVRVLEPERVDRVQLWQGIPGPPQYCFVMEYMAGGDFRRAVKEGRLEPAERLRVILAIGEALTFAHTHELKAIHRDVKPQNILLGTEGEIRLTDFDLVRVAESKGGTRTGALGTFIYAAPEELEAANKVDARSDVFSLGMTALFAIKGDDLNMTDFRNAEHTIETLEASDAIKEVLARAVSWEAEERYETMAEFCEELRVATLGKEDGTGPQ